MKKKVGLFFLSELNFDTFACKFVILSLNKIQECFQFEFPELRDCSFPSKGNFSSPDDLSDLFEKFSQITTGLNEKTPTARCDYYIGITCVGIGEHLFWQKRDNMALITTDTWEKLFSPPSVFEYIVHSMAGSLVQMMSEIEHGSLISSHPETKGCLLDYKFFKKDMKVAISLGYICDECKSKNRTVLGQDIATCIDKISARDWIGEVGEAGSVAYNLKRFFKVDLNKDTGFTKTFWEKAKESFPELPKDLVLIIVTAIITYLATRLSL